MAEQVFGFPRKETEDIASTVRRVQQRPNEVIQQAVSRGGRQTHQFVRITSTTKTDGRYPGAWLLYDEVLQTWSDGDGAIWVVHALDGALTTGPRYLARLWGNANGRAVYVCVGNEENMTGVHRVKVTTSSLPAYTRSGNTITASANGALTAQDGVSLSLGDRLLLNRAPSHADNGLYYVSSLGSAGSPFVLVRTTDADESGKVLAGLLVIVTQGTSYADTLWELSTDNPITLNTTALTFALLTSLTVQESDGSPNYTGINTLQFDVAAGFVVTQPGTKQAKASQSEASLTTVGYITLGTQHIKGAKCFNTSLGTGQASAGGSVGLGYGAVNGGGNLEIAPSLAGYDGGDGFGGRAVLTFSNVAGAAAFDDADYRSHVGLVPWIQESSDEPLNPPANPKGAALSLQCSFFTVDGAEYQGWASLEVEDSGQVTFWLDSPFWAAGPAGRRANSFDFAGNTAFGVTEDGDYYRGLTEDIEVRLADGTDRVLSFKGGILVATAESGGSGSGSGGASNIQRVTLGSQATADVSSLTLSQKTTQTGDLLIVLLYYTGGTGAVSVTAATYNGAAMTLDKTESRTNGGTDYVCKVYSYPVNANTTGDIVITFNTAGGVRSIAALRVSGLTNRTAAATASADGGATDPDSTDLTTGANAYVQGAVTLFRSGGYTAGSWANSLTDGQSAAFSTSHVLNEAYKIVTVSETTAAEKTGTNNTDWTAVCVSYT